MGAVAGHMPPPDEPDDDELLDACPELDEVPGNVPLDPPGPQALTARTTIEMPQ